jgi:hypothetical protein
MLCALFAFFYGFPALRNFMQGLAFLKGIFMKYILKGFIFFFLAYCVGVDSIAANDRGTFYNWYHHHLIVGGGLAYLNQNTEGTTFSGLTNSVGMTYYGSLVRIHSDPKITGAAHLAYQFDNLNDIDLSYFLNNHHLNGSYGDGGSTIRYPSPTLLPADWGQHSFAYDATSEFQYKQKALNLMLGHWYHGASGLGIHPAFGLAYAQLGQEQYTVYTNVNGTYIEGGSTVNLYSNPSGKSAVIDQKSTVRGLGPEIGVDFEYKATNALRFIATCRLSLLVGNMRSIYYGYNPADESGLVLPATKIMDKTKQTIFEHLDIHVGPTYHLELPKGASADISLGYQVGEYLHGLASNHSVDDYMDGVITSMFKDSSVLGPELKIDIHL